MVGEPERMWKAIWSQHSIVGTAARLKLEYRKIVIRFLVWVRDFPLLQNIQICAGVHPAPYSIDNLASFPPVKVAIT
jgi:hypothetical protein